MSVLLKSIALSFKLHVLLLLFNKANRSILVSSQLFHGLAWTLGELW